MNNINDRLREMRELEERKVESEKRFKSLILHTIEEIRKKGRARKMSDDQKTLCEILFEYLAKIKMSLPYGKNTQECCHWWRNEVVPRKDILEAFESYLEGKLTKEFESCRDKIEASTKINVAERISILKF